MRDFDDNSMALESRQSSLLEQHNVRLLGSGDTLVVMGHGFGTDQTVWQHCVPHLATRYRLLLFDLMGAGSTDPDLFSFTRYRTSDCASASESIMQSLIDTWTIHLE